MFCQAVPVPFGHDSLLKQRYVRFRRLVSATSATVCILPAPSTRPRCNAMPCPYQMPLPLHFIRVITATLAGDAVVDLHSFYQFPFISIFNL
jgi:hypothetical protein